MFKKQKNCLIDARSIKKRLGTFSNKKCPVGKKLKRQAVETFQLESGSHNLVQVSQNALAEKDNFSIINKNEIGYNKYQDLKLKDQLLCWSYEYFIGENALDSLLKVLNGQNLKLPMSAKGLRRPLHKILLEPNSEGQMFVKDLKQTLVQELDRYDNKLVPNDIEIEVSFDGAPPNHSKYQIWPIMLKFRNMSPSSPFFFAFYGGYCKPDFKNLLTPLVDQYNLILQTSIEWNGRMIRCKITRIKGDLPAVAGALYTKNAGGYCCCRRCPIRGIYIPAFKKVVYLERNLPSRTDEDFRADVEALPDNILEVKMKTRQSSHVIGKSPLVRLPIDLVNDILIDSMHNILFGNVKPCIIRWIKGSGPAKLSSISIRILNEAIRKSHKFFPYEFPRKCPSLNDVNTFKATELKNFLLYVFFSLKNLLPDHISMHFLKLCCAIRLLNCPNNFLRHVNVAEILINEYFDECKTVYGTGHYTLNLHLLTHTIEDIKRNKKPIFEESCFVYENALYGLKKSLKFGPDPLQQAIRRDEELSRFKKKYQTDVEPIKLSKYDNSENKKLYKRVDLNTFILDSEREGDSYFLSTKSSVKLFIGAFIENGQVFILYRSLCYQVPAFEKPFDSGFLDIYMSNDEYTEYLETLHYSEVKSKLFRLPITQTLDYIYIPLQHTDQQNND